MQERQRHVTQERNIRVENIRHQIKCIGQHQRHERVFWQEPWEEKKRNQINEDENHKKSIAMDIKSILPFHLLRDKQNRPIQCPVYPHTPS